MTVVSRGIAMCLVTLAFFATALGASSPAFAQEVIRGGDGKCVTDFGNARATIDEMKAALTYDCGIKTRGIRKKTTEVADVGVPTCPDETAVALNIEFEFDSAKLTDMAKLQLQDVAALVRDFPTCAFLFEGHTDAVGDEAYNLGLSKRRAWAAAAYLHALEVGGDRIATQGLGETRLLVPSEPSSQRNRRVEISISGEAEVAQR